MSDVLIPLTPELVEQLRNDLKPLFEERNKGWDAVKGELEALGGVWTCSACPVQAEGEVDGHPWYFRARGEHWSFSVAEIGGDAVGEPKWERSEEWGDREYAAGWMDPGIALGFIKECLEQFRKGALLLVEGGGGQ